MKLLLSLLVILLMQKRFLAPYYLFQANTTFTDSLRSLLPDTRLNDYYFRQLYDLNRNLQQTGRTPLQLTPTETGLLHTIAQSQTNMAYSAHSLLYLAHGEEYQQNLPPLPDELMTANWQMYINYKQGVQATAHTTVDIYPNPATQYLNIKYTQPDNTPALLEWYNITGVLQYRQTLTQSGTYKVDVSQWKSGVYYCRIWQGNTLKKHKKVVIVR